MVITSAAPHVIDMPGWRPIVKQVATTVVMISLLPLAVFYIAMSLFGLRTAALATVGLYYVGLLVKVLRGRPVLAAARLAALFLSVRTAIIFITGSAFLYFLQPVAGTVALAIAIGATAVAGRPVLDRLAHEFCPFPAELSTRLRRARFFRRLSVIWSVSYFINAVGTVWLLSTASVGGFILLKSALGPAVWGAAGVASYLVFRATIRGQNVRIRWAHHQKWMSATV